MIPSGWPPYSRRPVKAVRVKAMTSAIQTLDAAERFCTERGLSLTPMRRRVLELLVEAGGPVKAYDLLSALKPGGAAQPPTVYRALDFLTRAGLAHKVEALNAYTACLNGHDEEDPCTGSAELFICESCGNVDERHMHRTPSDAPDGFVISRSVVEHYGQCARCAN